MILIIPLLRADGQWICRAMLENPKWVEDILLHVTQFSFKTMEESIEETVCHCKRLHPKAKYKILDFEDMSDLGKKGARTDGCEFDSGFNYTTYKDPMRKDWK